MEHEPEKWRPISTWPRKGIDGHYEISDRGRVRCTDDQSIVATAPNANGQRIVGLQAKLRKKSGKVVYKVHRRLVHLLVYDTFIGPRAKGLEVTHLDWDRDNNAVENLALATHDEIMERAGQAGRLPWLWNAATA